MEEKSQAGFGVRTLSDQTFTTEKTCGNDGQEIGRSQTQPKQRGSKKEIAWRRMDRLMREIRGRNRDTEGILVDVECSIIYWCKDVIYFI